jgi:hypothetical protein
MTSQVANVPTKRGRTAGVRLHRSAEPLVTRVRRPPALPPSLQRNHSGQEVRRMIGIVVPPNQGGESGSPSVALVAVLAVGAILLAVALRGWYCDQCRFNFFMMEGNPPCENPVDCERAVDPIAHVGNYRHWAATRSGWATVGASGSSPPPRSQQQDHGRNDRSRHHQDPLSQGERGGPEKGLGGRPGHDDRL